MTRSSDHPRRAHASPHARAIASIVASIIALSSSPANAVRILYESSDYVVEATGAIDNQPDYTYIKAGITIPPSGYVFLTTQHSIELYLPCKGWVPDKGIIIVLGCPEDQQGGDTLNAPVTLTPDMGCVDKDGRVLILIRVPHMFMTEDCRPTQLRWTGGYHAKTD